MNSLVTFLLLKYDNMKRYLAEGIGTFALVFCGTGAIIINDLSNGTVSHTGIAMTFGFIVMVMIYAFGNVSGAHINPAVTIAFSFTDIFDRKDLIPYLIAQLCGAMVASVSLSFLFEHETLGTTLPSGAVMQSFVLEVILTFLLMLVILMVSQDESIHKFTGLAVGGTVLLEALFAGPICGASMNPARSIAPALVSGTTSHLWVYVLATTLGAVIAVFCWKIISNK